MKAKTKNVFRVVVGIIFMVLGLSSVLSSLPSVIGNTLALEFHFIWGLAFDVAMFFAGLLALLRLKRSTCVVLAVILFVGFAIAAVSSIMANANFFNVVLAGVKAVVAWLFIGCVK